VRIFRARACARARVACCCAVPGEEAGAEVSRGLTEVDQQAGSVGHRIEIFLLVDWSGLVYDPTRVDGSHNTRHGHKVPLHSGAAAAAAAAAAAGVGTLDSRTRRRRRRRVATISSHSWRMVRNEGIEEYFRSTPCVRL
jgi:hypothetical protein